MNVPTVLTIHQLPVTATSHFPGHLQVMMENLLWRYGRWYTRKFMALIAPTETTSIQVRRILSRPVTTISNGIDLLTFYPSRHKEEAAAIRIKWKLPLDVPLILHVGRLDPDKNVERVTHAAALVMQENSLIC